MNPSLPERTREYRSFLFDSRNWEVYRPRAGDVVVTTSYKSGTTWMQNIVLRLIFQGREVPAVSAVSPWIDRRRTDLTELAAQLDAQTHRRVLKSHLPLDAIPYFPGTRYIVVVRDARDVFMSLWNHYANLTDAVFAHMNDPAVLIGPPAPRAPADIHEFWDGWINRGWFDWESEGYPHSGNLNHTRSWWAFRHLPNILFVHFNDLLADPRGEIPNGGRLPRHPGPGRGADRDRRRGQLRRHQAQRGDGGSNVGGARARHLDRRSRHLLLPRHQRPLARGAGRRRARHVPACQGPRSAARLRPLHRARPRRAGAARQGRLGARPQRGDQPADVAARGIEHGADLGALIGEHRDALDDQINRLRRAAALADLPGDRHRLLPRAQHPGLHQHPGAAAVAGAGHLDAGIAVLMELPAVLACQIALKRRDERLALRAAHPAPRRPEHAGCHRRHVAVADEDALELAVYLRFATDRR